MADGVAIDFSEIQRLAADLGNAPRDAGKRIRQATEISARKIKDTWAEKLTGENGLPHAPRSITYDLVAQPGDAQSTISAEIGPERGRLQAPIVVVMEFGAPGNNTPPRGYGAGALYETSEDFQKGLEIAVAEPLK